MPHQPPPPLLQLSHFFSRRPLLQSPPPTHTHTHTLLQPPLLQPPNSSVPHPTASIPHIFRPPTYSVPPLLHPPLFHQPPLPPLTPAFGKNTVVGFLTTDAGMKKQWVGEWKSRRRRRRRRSKEIEKVGGLKKKWGMIEEVGSRKKREGGCK